MVFMLTFVSGWKGQDRDQALVSRRDPDRRAIFFTDGYINSLESLPDDASVVDLYRNGRLDFKVGEEPNTIVRINYDTDMDLTMQAITHVLLTGADAQIIVMYDALERLYRLFPALRAADALLAANERLDAPAGDRVFFTRGGSFRWTDHLIEARTSLLTSTEVFDAGIVPDEDDL
jgi:hypothetical protein